ncbi:MAG: EamA family transporter [Actinomycetota bacterium]
MPLEVPPSDPLAAAGTRPSAAISLVLILVSVVFAVAGQVTLKSAMTEVGRIGAAQVTDAADTILRAVKEPRLWAGLFLFGISALFWLVVLSRVPLSVAYPFVGMSYVLVVLLSRFVLHEQVPASRWLGVFVVAAGIVIIGLSFRAAAGK